MQRGSDINEVRNIFSTVFSIFGCDNFLDASSYINIEFRLFMAFQQLDTTSTKATGSDLFWVVLLYSLVSMHLSFDCFGKDGNHLF